MAALAVDQGECREPGPQRGHQRVRLDRLDRSDARVVRTTDRWRGGGDSHDGRRSEGHHAGGRPLGVSGQPAGHATNGEQGDGTDDEQPRDTAAWLDDVEAIVWSI